MITIDGYGFDAALKQEEQLDTAVTQFPVEEGADVTDHIRTLPIVFSVDGVVSDTPLGAAAVARAGVQALIEEGLTEATTASADARKKLKEIRAGKQPVTVTTSTELFENMVMTGLNFPRDGKTGAALRFTAVFTEVRILANERVRVAVPRAAKKRKSGNKPAGYLEGTFIARCKRDRNVYIKPADVALAKSTQGNTLAVFADWLPRPFRPYTTRIRLCVEKERVLFDRKADNGRGAYLGPNGEPLTPDQTIDLAVQMSEESDIANATSAVPIDARTSQPLPVTDRSFSRNLPTPSGPSPEPVRPWWTGRQF